MKDSSRSKYAFRVTGTAVSVVLIIISCKCVQVLDLLAIASYLA